MYGNLKKEMRARGVKRLQLADDLGMTFHTIHNKVTGKSAFSVVEALEIRRKYFPDCSIEYLFAVTADREA